MKDTNLDICPHPPKVDKTLCTNCRYFYHKFSNLPDAMCDKCHEYDRFETAISEGEFMKECCCENREWSTGAKRDPNEGKGRMDLLPWNAIIEISKHCQKGAEHYGEHNVDKGIPLSSLCDSGARHLAKFMDGWTDEDHLLAAAWNILWAVQMRAKKPDMVDIPWEDKK